MRKTTYVIGVVWVLLVGLSFFYNYFNLLGEQEQIALKAASSFFDQILISRAWNAAHGGVYVPVTKNTRPNPYLDVALREIKVNEGLTLTKVNPAFMTRQIAEIALARKGIHFHITSLNPIRPGNRPDAVEEKALRRFEEGRRQEAFFFDKDGRDYFFYMAPLVTTEACLQCHAEQGYQVGDIRGGISVTLPFAPSLPGTALFLGHLIIGLVGGAGIAYFGRRLERAYSVIQRQAVMDSLTGIPNRRSFGDTMQNEFRRCQRDRRPLSVLLCDIDDFKSYNDTFGHAVGDRCLRRVAQAIDSALERAGDFCARYGGEEFVVILPDTDLRGAEHVAEVIRKSVQDLAMEHPAAGRDGIVTVSLGAAAGLPGPEAAYEGLLKRADEALYRAKKSGRNRVETAPPA